MDKDTIDHLKTLHTSAIDARNGYEEALEDAESKGMTGLFRDMIALHDGNAEELHGILINAGEEADSDGSFMSIVHRTIMSVRSLFNGLDGSVLAGLIDGEKRNVGKYDDALKGVPASTVVTLLTAQRSKIEQQIASMQEMKTAYEGTAS